MTPMLTIPIKCAERMFHNGGRKYHPTFARLAKEQIANTMGTTFVDDYEQVWNKPLTNYEVREYDRELQLFPFGNWL